ncbi:pyruvate kinase-like protein [Aspergillus alliaceus]|uniref:Pyruvate kinase-like protein n=1 Tax=Petromyces alliaceus TaxID=209559 RepID=A0A5N7C599_PETAA|nr:pyruvate kinase-like protein [Aspergillus alliaceus]
MWPILPYHHIHSMPLLSSRQFPRNDNKNSSLSIRKTTMVILKQCPTQPRVLSVTTSSSHNFSKNAVSSINLISGYGIEGDCHAGTTVQHRSRLHIKPPPANLRQVHLIPTEILTQVSSTMSSDVKNRLMAPGALGQNITTEGIDLLGLGVGTELHFVDDNSGGEDEAVLVVTGLRNPCPQIDKFQAGLKERFLVRDGNRRIVGRLAGVMATVKQGGVIKPGMRAVVVEPERFVALEAV